MTSPLHTTSRFSSTQTALVTLLCSLALIPLIATTAQGAEDAFEIPVATEQVHRDMIQRVLANPTPPALTETPEGLRVCWQEGTDPDLRSAFDRALEKGGVSSFTFSDGSRWSTTATDGSGLSQGDPTTITWGFADDGTAIDGFIGEAANPSNLIAFLDGIYGAGPGGSDLTQRPWFTYFEQMFDNWSSLIGCNYVYEPADDGAALAYNNGVLGVRADVRIGGHLLDGNSGTLAYNFFPNTGDMVIDTGDNFYTNTANNSRRLRNVLAHEHGHGLGISHVCPVNGTKLMEPFINTSYDGVQFDDRLAGNRGYGDTDEFPVENDTFGNATDFGAVSTPGNASTQRSIDDNSDTDYFSFTVGASTTLDVTLTPDGTTYLSGPQNANGSCSAGSNFNALAQSNLEVRVYDTDGTTVLASANATSAGNPETISSLALPGAGTYFVRVLGTANAAQIYTVDLTTSGGVANDPPTAVCQDVESCDGNVVAADVDNGSSDPDLDPINLTLEPAGPYGPGVTVVDLIVDDGSLADTCSATITVNSAPSAVCRNFEVSGAGAGCSVAVDPDSLDDGSSDIDGGPLTFTLDPAGPFSAGVTAVSFIVTDSCGAADTCQATITVVCEQAPEALCQDVFSCDGNVVAADVDNGSSDPNGDPINLTLEPAGPYAPGVTVVDLIVDDGALADTCSATITVNSAPSAVCRNFEVSGSGAGCSVAVDPDSLDDGSSDIDGGPLTFTLDPTGPFAAGVTAVNFIVTDSCGAADTCAATVTVTCFNGPVLDVDPASVSLPSVAPGDTTCQVMTVRNTGDQDLTINSISGCSSGNFFLDLTGTASLVAPGDSTTFLVCASPAGGGLDTCEVTVDTPDSTAMVSVFLGETLDTPGVSGTGAVLAAVVPNPFRSRAAIQFNLPVDGRVRVEVFDFQGRRLRTLLADQVLTAGAHVTEWDGRNERSQRVASGIYYIRLVSPVDTRVVRAVLLP